MNTSALPAARSLACSSRPKPALRFRSRAGRMASARRLGRTARTVRQRVGSRRGCHGGTGRWPCDRVPALSTTTSSHHCADTPVSAEGAERTRCRKPYRQIRLEQFGRPVAFGRASPNARAASGSVGDGSGSAPVFTQTEARPVPPAQLSNPPQTLGTARPDIRCRAHVTVPLGSR